MIDSAQEDLTPGAAPLGVLDDSNPRARLQGIGRPIVIVQPATDDRFECATVYPVVIVAQMHIHAISLTEGGIRNSARARYSRQIR